jgi:disulfide bond formation protein DsbB
MKYLTSGRVGFAFLWVALFVLLIVTAMGYNPSARIFPLIVAIPVLIGAIGNLYVDMRMVQRGEKPAKDKPHSPSLVTTEPVAVAPETKKKEKVSGKERTKREFIGIAWLIGYVVALLLFGFNLATLVYLVAFIKFYSHESWKLTIVYSAVLWVFVYVAFVVFLKSTLAPGMVFDWLQR